MLVYIIKNVQIVFYQTKKQHKLSIFTNHKSMDLEDEDTRTKDKRKGK